MEMTGERRFISMSRNIRRWKEILLWAKKDTREKCSFQCPPWHPAHKRQCIVWSAIHTPSHPSKLLVTVVKRRQRLLQLPAAFPHRPYLTPSQTRGPGPRPTRSEEKKDDRGPGCASVLGMALVSEKELDWQLMGWERERLETGVEWGQHEWTRCTALPSSPLCTCCSSFFVEWNPTLYFKGVWKMHPSENVQKLNIAFDVTKGFPLPER